MEWSGPKHAYRAARTAPAYRLQTTFSACASPQATFATSSASLNRSRGNSLMLEGRTDEGSGAGTTMASMTEIGLPLGALDGRRSGPMGYNPPPGQRNHCGRWNLQPMKTESHSVWTRLTIRR